MHGVVLGTGVGFEIVVVVALHAENGLHAQNSVQIGVFTAGLLSASPTRVAEDVDVGTPEGELGVTGIVGHTHGNVEQLGIAVVGAVPVGTGLVGHGGEHVVDQLVAERCGHTDGLRIDGVASLTNSVTGLAPPVVGGDVQAVDGDRLVHHQTDLLLGGEQREEVLNTLGVRECGVQIRILEVGAHRLRHCRLRHRGHKGLDGQGAEGGTGLVEQFDAAEALASFSVAEDAGNPARVKDNHHLGFLSGLDCLVGIDGLNAFATGDALRNEHGSLRLVLKGERVANGAQRCIHLLEVPFVGIKRYGALLLSRERACGQERTNSNNN